MKTWRNLVKLYNEMKFSELEKYFGDIYHYEIFLFYFITLCIFLYLLTSWYVFGVKLV